MEDVRIGRNTGSRMYTATTAADGDSIVSPSPKRYSLQITAASGTVGFVSTERAQAVAASGRPVGNNAAIVHHPVNLHIGVDGDLVRKGWFGSTGITYVIMETYLQQE